MLEVKKIISDYYEEVQKAFKNGKIDFSKLHLDDHVKVIGPNEKFEGKKKVEEMFLQFIAIVDHFDIKKQYCDHDSCCTVLDCISRSPKLSIATAEWILIKNGKIVEIRPIYDTSAWEQAKES